ncbi:NB-ARC domains-containing protein, partial [Tanacetum coccineum]
REVDIWREALSMAADLSGFDLQDMTNGFEPKFIDALTKEILKKLCTGPVDVGENLVVEWEKLHLPNLFITLCTPLLREVAFVRMSKESQNDKA